MNILLNINSLNSESFLAFLANALLVVCANLFTA